MYYIYYIYCSFLFMQKKNKKKQNVTRFGSKISNKLRECFSDFLVLTKFLRLEETVDWLKQL